MQNSKESPSKIDVIAGPHAIWTTYLVSILLKKVAISISIIANSLRGCLFVLSKTTNEAPKAIYISILLCFTIAFQGLAQTRADDAFYNHTQSQWLSKKTGRWEVTMTLRPAKDAKPISIKGLEAERTMTGAFDLHETMQPAKGTAMPLFKRISDLNYNLNNARWDYASIDTRITAGIMFFTNYANEGDSIVSYILDFPHPGLGIHQTDRGKNVRCRNVIITIDENHDTVKQYWKLTGGEEWLAVCYDYTRAK
jgi:hypothetical protein